MSKPTRKDAMTEIAVKCPICKSEASPLDKLIDGDGFDCPTHKEVWVARGVVDQYQNRAREEWERAFANAKSIAAGTGGRPVIRSYDFTTGTTENPAAVHELVAKSLTVGPPELGRPSLGVIPTSEPSTLAPSAELIPPLHSDDDHVFGPTVENSEPPEPPSPVVEATEAADVSEAPVIPASRAPDSQTFDAAAYQIASSRRKLSAAVESTLGPTGVPRPLEPSSGQPSQALGAGVGLQASMGGQGGIRAAAEIVGPPNLASIPDQYPAPVRVEERDGRIALVHETGELLAAGTDFNDWRDPIIEHIEELCSGDFRKGTNHSRVRDRLIALGSLLTGSLVEMKRQQFRIGYEVDRLGGLIAAYRSGGDDMPILNAAVLEDLDQLHLALRIGMDKFQRWAEFRRQAAADPEHEGEANPIVVADAVEKMTSAMEAQPKYFNPELPACFRFIIEALRDPRGATKAIVYGAVKSAENLISFLAKRAFGIANKTLDHVEQSISKTAAKVVILTLTGGALALSGALPQGWAWLKPLLDYLVKTSGG